MRRIDPDKCCPLCGAVLAKHTKEKCERAMRRRHTTESELRDKKAEHRDMFGQRLADGFAMLSGFTERREEEDE